MNSQPVALRKIGCAALALVLSLSMGCGRAYVITQKRLNKLEPQKTTKDQVIKTFGEPDTVEAQTPAGETLTYVQRKRQFMRGGAIGSIGMGLYWGLAGLAFAGGPAGLVVVPPAMLIGAAAGAAGGSLFVKDVAFLRVHLNPQNVVEKYEVVPVKK